MLNFHVRCTRGICWSPLKPQRRYITSHNFSTQPPTQVVVVVVMSIMHACVSVNHTSPMSSFSFAGFYESWFDHLQHLLHQLSAATRPPSTAEENHKLLILIDKVMAHYNDYYITKSVAAQNDPLQMLVSPWATTLERSLHWIAGWRPTIAFHLVYTESSVLFESHIIYILRGVRTGDLGDLSPSQFRRVSQLQCDTVKEENAITEELSEWQDSGSEVIEGAAEMEEKMEVLGRIIRKADDLRLRTLKSVVGLLTPQQAVDFLIASAELLSGIRSWGINHDRRRSR